MIWRLEFFFFFRVGVGFDRLLIFYFVVWILYDGCWWWGGGGMNGLIYIYIYIGCLLLSFSIFSNLFFGRWNS